MSLFEGLSLLGLVTALVLPWLAGALAVRLLSTRPIDRPRTIGYGFLAGQLIIIALLSAWDAAGLQLAFWQMVLPLGLATAVMATMALRRKPPGPKLPAWSATTWLGWAALLLMVALRFGLLAQELALRPLYAWDAWMNWVPRAVVWFHHLQLTPFVLPPEWLEASPDAEVYSLGNRRASGYPAGVPLILLWTMLGSATDDHTLLFLPWLLAPAAFTLALWGHLREHRAGPVLSMLVVYLFISLPLVAVHTMLVGYADIWLACYFSLGVMAVDAHHRSGNLAWAVLALTMAAGCVLMKTPGLVFGALVVSLAALSLMMLPARWWRRLALGGCAGIIGLLALGLMPGFAGEGTTLSLPFFLPELRLQPRPLLPILWEQGFVFANWHLLWLAVPLAALAAFLRCGRSAFAAPSVTALLSGAFLLVFVFGVTHYFRQAENLLTLNRSLLYLVPLAAYLVGCWLAAASREDSPGQRTTQPC